MANKLLVFLGLADNEDIVLENHRKQRKNYMERLQGLVVEDAPKVRPLRPKANEEQEIPAPEKTAPAAPVAEPVAEPVTPVAQTAAQPAQATEEKTEQKDVPATRHSLKDTAGIAGRFLKTRKETQPQLVLVRKRVSEMVDDIEEALGEGKSVLIDFSSEDPQKAKTALARVVNYVRLHSGAYFAVTKTSLLVTSDRNNVVEWLPEEPEGAESATDQEL